MSAGILKLIALLTMLIDHVGLLFFPQYPEMRMIGRISFPLYCFLLVQGFSHTRSRKNYLIRLLAFAVISEIPYQLFVAGELRNPLQGSNIFFELSLGFLAMIFLKKAETENKLWGTVPVLLCIAAQLLHLSYGAYGIAVISLLYLFRKNMIGSFLALSLCTAFYCMHFSNPIQNYASAAGMLFLFYNGQKGKSLPKYLFYVFYPAHLCVLYLIHLWLT